LLKRGLAPEEEAAVEVDVEEAAGLFSTPPLLAEAVFLVSA
jgi:hypothetical protein